MSTRTASAGGGVPVPSVSRTAGGRAGDDGWFPDRPSAGGDPGAPADIRAPGSPSLCDKFVAAPGAAWPWCDECGWRLDIHEPDHPIAKRWAASWKGPAL